MSKKLGMENRKTLKDLIQETDLSYRQLAERLGMTHNQLLALCKPGANPTLKTLVKLARELGVSLNELAKAFGAVLDGIPDDCNIGGNEDK
jgi:transcriptional regulator with XRE-family HTH domain